MTETVYADASALVKLAVREHESDALRQRLLHTDVVTSGLSRTEMQRAIVRRLGSAAHDDLAQQVLDVCMVLEVDQVTLHAAASVPPAELGSLDAIHLVSALRVQDAINAFICYDARLGGAAQAHGLRVEAPGEA